MAEEVRNALPADAAFMVAAVADWKSRHVAGEKMKKRGSAPPALILAENPDILATICASDRRPALVVGFAAETDDVVAHATAKRARKGCDWIVANDVSLGTGTFGGAENTVHIVREEGVEDWPRMGKQEVADRLARRITEALHG